MKKVVISLSILLVIVVLLAGCLDYKAYDLPKEDTSQDEQNLVDEIAAIENQLNTEKVQAEEVKDTSKDIVKEPTVPEEVAGEVVLPELTEKPKPVEVNEKDLEIINVKENELVKLNIKVNDPDKDIVTYSFSKPLSKEGEWKTNYGDAGEYVVTITASDGKLTTEKKIKIMVERVNVPPVIGEVKDITVNEGETVKFEPKVSDPNKDAVSITVSDPLKGGTFVTDHTSAGDYEVKVQANDGELDSEKKFKLTVKDVNVLPEVTGLKDITVKEGETVSIKPTISDLDGDKVKLTISEPVGPSGEWKTTFSDHGKYVVTVTIDDGKDKVVKNLNVIIEDVNMPPEIVSVGLTLNK
ncbi:MAG TPA: hypothetical protein VJA23_03090 [Candidatus Nanoarchaeia archaeon]|nr:hypothetical protein [Candidatus Nanoarchaeia archaeon]